MNARVLAVWLLVATLLPAVPLAVAGTGASARLEELRAQIRKLELELERLRANERGLLGELERLSAEIQLREAERRVLTLEVQEVREKLAGQTAELDDLRARQETRRGYLTFRLREIYKGGENRWLRRWLDDDGAALSGGGIRFATFLSARDGRTLREFRDAAREIETATSALAAREAELADASRALDRARERLGRTRREHAASLESIRTDSRRREAALAELRGAADALQDWIDGVGARPEAALDVDKFRGLLEWPADGEVGAGFGTRVHPRFKTEVPHPGLDIEGAFGSPIRAVFDGEVVFAAWMRGYGLTAIVDHGGGLLSIYAHASALLVEKGQRVRPGQRLGLVGDSGSFRGPYLYFELRKDGRPVDPAEWLRPR